MKKTILTAMSAFLISSAVPAAAELVFPLLSYRTGAYAPNGIPIADGFSDYLTLINERDGGIGGEKIKMIECETAYNTEKGVECYESTKGQGSLVYWPLSTGITYQLIPKVTADGIPLHTMGYGRTSAANGKVFSHVFNFPGTYWDAASIITKHMMDVEGGSLKGKKIVLVHHNSAYGKEPIRTFEVLAEKHGFEFITLPVDHPGQEQKSTWLQVRKERPDFVTMWGWGVMNQVAIKEAASIRFPMDRFIGVWGSSNEGDVLPAGDGATGYKAIALHNTGTDFDIYKDLEKHVISKGLAAGAGDHVGEVLYNRGFMQGALVVEAARTAQKIHGVANITPAMMRDGMEALKIDQARWAEMGLANYAADINVTCENHGGPGLGAIQQWNASTQKWTMITDFVAADRSVVDPLIMADSAAYAAENNISERCN
jgi:branched-chain amino acid transport system substrate-binding protein